MAGLTSSNRLTKDVLVLPVVVPELELGDVERQIFGADLVERADDAAFKDAPEALDRVRMDRADYILALGVVDDLVRVLAVQTAIAYPLVGHEQANLLRYCIRVDPRSQKCSGCNELVPKSLAVRIHACPHCGLVIDRDWNASLNIRQAGIGLWQRNVSRQVERAAGNIREAA